FSTAWDIVRKHPAVLFRTAEGQDSLTLHPVRLDLPMIVGPLPWTDGITMERAWLEAIAAADPEEDLLTASLLVVEAEGCIAHGWELLPHAAHLVPRLESRHLAMLEAGEGALLADLRG